ncbi:MAG: tetratricopeptide repeat protein [Ignavibacteria bacterium]|nr:tetratricopeptide repeat protein [Ignavibacteria bacterium]
MEEIILQTKIIPEKNLAKILKRDNLLDKLKENVSKNIIVISAGAGYGKTTLVRDFVSRYKLKAAWYKIDETDDNIYLFFSYLINAIANIESTFGKGSLQIIDSIKTRANIEKNIDNIISTVGGTFINEFIKIIKGEFYIILDDIHLLPKSDWVIKSLTYLFENIPGNLHYIITSREQLPIKTAKLHAKRKLFELKTDDLKFRENELKELAVQFYNQTMHDVEVNLILGRFDGWITGLHLYLQSGKDETSFTELDENLPASLYNYFAEDIFASVKENTKDFLLNTCMLDNFSEKTCSELLNITTSKKILNELLSRNIFIQRSEGRKGFIFNYQVLFKEFLRLKYNESKPKKEKQDLLTKIAEYYQAKDDFVSAIKYFLLAEDYDTSLKLILKHIEEFGESSNLVIVDKWIKALPGEIQEENPHIIFYKGCLSKNIYGDLDKALNYFETSLKKFKEKQDSEFENKTYTNIAEVLIKTGNIQKAIEILIQLKKKKLDPVDQAKILYWLAVAYINMTDYEKSLKLLTKALEISNTENLKDIKYAILNDLGNICLIQGDYTKSMFYYEKVLSHIKNIYNKFQTLTNIVQLYSYEGNYEKAKETLDEARNIENLYTSQFFKISYLLSSAYLSYMVCDYEKAITIWKELLSIATKSNIEYYIYISYYNIAACYMYLKKFEKSREYFKLAKELVKKLSEGEKIYFNYWLSILNKEENRQKDVEKNLKEAHEYFKTNNMLYDKAHAELHLADYYLEKGESDAALKYITASIDAVDKKEYNSMLQKEILFKRNVFDFIIENKINPELMSKVYFSVLDLDCYNWGSDEFKKRLNLSIDKFYDLKVTTFGGLNIKIRGKLIPDDLWVRKIRKLIFAYIILNYKKNITKDSLIDLFYPESTPENADNIFHQTLSNIRAIIKKEAGFCIPVLKSKKWTMLAAPSYISYQKQILSLNPYYLYNVDVFDFENSYRKGVSLSENEREEHLKNAVNLYKGNFLEGFYQSWCEEMRKTYEQQYESALKELIKLINKNFRYEDVVLYSEKLLKIDNLNEEAYLYKIEALVKLNNISKAKAVAKLMHTTYQKELGEELPGEILNKIKEVLQNF